MLAFALLVGSALLAAFVWRRRPRSPLVLASTLGFALAPVASIELAGGFMVSHGCHRGNELSAEPRLVRGTDVAWLLEEATVYSVAQPLTLTVGALPLLFWLGPRRWPALEP